LVLKSTHHHFTSILVALYKDQQEPAQILVCLTSLEMQVHMALVNIIF